jgi:ABC-type sugar transport system ATPase subunit
MNFVEGRVAADEGALVFTSEGARVRLPGGGIAAAVLAEPVTLGIRPEDLRVDPTAPQGESVFGRVVLVERLGGTSHIHFDVGPHRMMASVASDSMADVGESITVRVPADRVHLFGLDGRALPTALGSRSPR